MKICVQAGHINIGKNSDVLLRPSTGAPGEQKFNLRIATRVCELLKLRNFEVKQTDANANDDPQITNNDWDLFLSIHYDANIYKVAGTDNLIGGGFVDFPDPSTDEATVKSESLCNILRSQYFTNTGIVEHPERSNKNTRFYYMWRALSASTPCVVIECGVGEDPHDAVILADTDRVSNAIVKGICKGFNVPFEVVTNPCPELTTKIVELTDERNAALTQATEMKKKYDDLNATYTAIQALGISNVDDLQKERIDYEKKLSGAITEIAQTKERNAQLADEIAKMEKEDATLLDEGLAGIRNSKDLKGDISDIKKALALAPRTTIDDLIKHIYELRSYFSKPKKDTFKPGINAPVVSTTKSNTSMWEILGLGGVLTLIIGSAIIGLNLLLIH